MDVNRVNTAEGNVRRGEQINFRDFWFRSIGSIYLVRLHHWFPPPTHNTLKQYVVVDWLVCTIHTVCLQFSQSDLLIVGILGTLAGQQHSWKPPESEGSFENDGPKGRTRLVSGQVHKCHCHSSCSCVNTNTKKCYNVGIAGWWRVRY